MVFDADGMEIIEPVARKRSTSPPRGRLPIPRNAEDAIAWLLQQSRGDFLHQRDTDAETETETDTDTSKREKTPPTETSTPPHDTPKIETSTSTTTTAPDTEAAVVKQNYRRLALLVHPDKCSLPHADEAFKLLHAAYEACAVL